jgi:hypothetical protein
MWRWYRFSFEKCEALKQTTAYFKSIRGVSLDIVGIAREKIAVFREIMLLSKIKQPNILSLLGVVRDPTVCYEH